jgi:AcrR family transcriptional regulator
VGTQARAHATRQTIIDSAVELFGELGFGGTGLVDIIERTGLTKGAFYYHFRTKESVAAAIIEDANRVIGDAMAASLATQSPMLEKLITSAFVVTELNEHNNLVRVGNLLRQSLIQVSPSAQESFSKADRGDLIASSFAQAAAEGDIRDDADPETLGYTAWAAMLGSRLLSEATGADPFSGVERVLRVVLAGVVKEGSAQYCEQFITRMAQRYAQADTLASSSAP